MQSLKPEAYRIYIVGNLNSLEGLNFSCNNFSGHIPSSLANIGALESLDLSSNTLVGTIPQQLTDLHYLEVLNLSYNQLDGPIPQGQQFNTFNNDSYLGNSGLRGFPLSRECGNGEALQLPKLPTLADEEDSWWRFDWKIAMMGYASGVVIGLSVGYMVFTSGKPWWFVKFFERKLMQM